MQSLRLLWKLSIILFERNNFVAHGLLRVQNGVWYLVNLIILYKKTLKNVNKTWMYTLKSRSKNIMRVPSSFVNVFLCFYESINNFTMKYGRCQFNSYQAMRYETSKTNWSIFQNPNSFFRTRLFFSVKLQILRNCSSIVIFQTVICFRKKFLNQRPFFLNFVLKLKVLIWTKVNCFPLVGDCTKPLWKTLYAQK